DLAPLISAISVRAAAWSGARSASTSNRVFMADFNIHREPPRVGQALARGVSALALQLRQQRLLELALLFFADFPPTRRHVKHIDGFVRFRIDEHNLYGRLLRG